MPIPKHLAAVVLLAAAIPATATAAGSSAHDPEGRIHALTKRIATHPRDARLYLQRGELYRHVEDRRRALVDFAKALDLDPGLHAVHLARARTLLEGGLPTKALDAVAGFVAAEPDHAGGWLVRARALTRLGKTVAAAEAYDRMLAALGRCVPQHHLEWARAQAALGPDGVDRALAGLDKALRELGPVVSLVQLAIDLEEERGHTDRALAHVRRMLTLSARPESWLARRAGILDRAGRAGEAREMRRRAISAIESLSPRRKNTRATRALLASLREALAGSRSGEGQVSATSSVADEGATIELSSKPKNDTNLQPPIAQPTAADAAESAESPAPTILVPRGSVWRYLDDGSNQGTAWSAPGFDDSQWASGPAELGYGEGGESTVLSFGPSATNKYITYYFRHSFQVANPGAFAALSVGVLRDDGAVVYLNGVEVARSNMSPGPIGYTTLAPSPAQGQAERTFHPFNLPLGALVQGTNVLAVEVHQNTVTSNDLSFDLELSDVPAVASVVRGPYLQRGSADGAVVRWRTDAGTTSVVWLGAAPGGLTVAATSSSITTEHAVAVSGLTPDTRYFYAVGDATGILAGDDNDHYFVTAPATGTAKPTRVWAIGDSGKALLQATCVRDAYLAHAAGQHTDVWLMLGDNAYDTGTEAEHQAAIFDMYPTLLRNAFLWPTLGNHDSPSASSLTESGVYYDTFTLPRAAEAGGTPSGTEAYYSFDHGNIHFIGLDSEDTDLSPGGAMMTWLRSDLANTRADWIIAFWHHPPYSKGSQDSDDPFSSGGRMYDMRQYGLPILEAGGVDLVLCGHSHSYERSFLLDSHYGVSSTLTPAMVLDKGDGRPNGDGEYVKATLPAAAHEGTVYVVAGSSSHISGGRLNHKAMYLSLNELGSMVLDIDGSRLDAIFLDDNAQVRDSFTIQKGVVRTLTRDEPRVSIATGGTQNLFLDAGPAFAGHTYVVAGSLSTTPGFLFGPVLVPLNIDPWFNHSLALANTPIFTQTVGFLDGNGRAQASINMPVFGIRRLVGLSLHHAFIGISPVGVPSIASNTVALTFTQ